MFSYDGFHYYFLPSDRAATLLWPLLKASSGFPLIWDEADIFPGSSTWLCSLLHPRLLLSLPDFPSVPCMYHDLPNAGLLGLQFLSLKDFPLVLLSIFNSCQAFRLQLKCHFPSLQSGISLTEQMYHLISELARSSRPSHPIHHWPQSGSSFLLLPADTCPDAFLNVTSF